MHVTPVCVVFVRVFLCVHDIMRFHASVLESTQCQYLVIGAVKEYCVAGLSHPLTTQLSPHIAITLYYHLFA